MRHPALDLVMYIYAVKRTSKHFELYYLDEVELSDGNHLEGKMMFHLNILLFEKSG